MAAYYNEHDPFAAAWLRELIRADLIADGEVDERSIADVSADDVRRFTQCHWFAGIGGWSYALRLAGWPDARAVWTGSCPCQPFSSAGTQAGGHDPRDLWPVWYQLLAQCRPAVVFSEQVEAAIGHGWLDRVCDDLEAQDYAVGACGLPAAGVGAFHIRQRLWFVADTARRGDGRYGGDARDETSASRRDTRTPDGDAVGSTSPMGDVAESRGEREQSIDRGLVSGHAASSAWFNAAANGRRANGDVAESEQSAASGRGLSGPSESTAVDSGWQASNQSERHGIAGDLADADDAGPQGRGRAVVPARAGERATGPLGASLWADAEWIPCSDGKARPVKPGIFPLAYGISNRVGILRGAGNAICPQVAQAFIESYMSLLR